MADLPDPDVDWIYIVELSPYDPDVPGQVNLYLATEPVFFDADDVDAPNRDYDGLVDVALSMNRAISFAGVFESDGQPSFGALTIKFDDEFNEGTGTYSKTAWQRFGWDGWPAEVLRGQRPNDGSVLRRSDFTSVFKGITAGGNTYGTSEVQVPLGGFAEQLRDDVATVTYAGSGGFEGGADMKGKLKPFLVGEQSHLPPTLVDSANEWWDVSPLTGCDSMDIYQGALLMVPDAANPPAAGKVYKDLANGRFRTNGQPTHPLTVTARSSFGDDGASGGALSAAHIVRDLLEDQKGIASANVDSTSINALHTDNSTPVGHYVTESETFESVINIILGSVGASHTEDVGVFEVFRVAAPTATSSTHADVDYVITDDDLALGELTERPRTIPPYRLDFDYHKCWTVLSFEQIVGAALNADIDFVIREWRREPGLKSATETKHKNSRPLIIKSQMNSQAAAVTEVAREADLFAVDQEFIDLPIGTAPFQLKLNQQIWLESDFYNKDTAYRVVEVGDRSKSARVDAVLWRPL